MSLLAQLADDPWSGVTPSVYETGRLVALAPWLTGHEARIRYLEETQHPDGTWGGPGEYALVPTLSAVDALQQRPAARKGLDALRRLFSRPLTLPDTVAVELIVPALAERLGLRTPLDSRRLHALRQRSLPAKLWHTLEIFGPRPEVTTTNGIVAASPAATAVQLQGPRPGASLDYLEAVQARHGGPVPAGVPVPLFERSWIIVALRSAGLDVPDPMVDRLEVSPEGAAGGPGLPADADDTATALHALALCGSPRPTQVLQRYREGRHFACFPHERTPSTSTNAHVLQALGHDRELEEWLRDMQYPEGCWRDKWHASPYYATACVTNALKGNKKAVQWVLRTQRDDGSWGRWEGTYEETAYAIRILSHSDEDEAVSSAMARGAKFMQDWGDRPHPPLWHDKDLYTPTRIVQAEGMAALHLTCVGSG